MIKIKYLLISMLMSSFMYAASCTTETADNLISNSCVEDGYSPWYHYNGATEQPFWDFNGHSGTHSMKIVNSVSQRSGWRYNYIPIENKRTITFGGWSKASNVSSRALYTLDFKIYYADGTSKYFYPNELRFSKGSHTWENREITYTFDKDVVGVRTYALLYYGTGTVWFDDIYVKVQNDDITADNNEEFSILYSQNSHSKILLLGNTSLCKKGTAWRPGSDGNGVFKCDPNGASQSESNNIVDMINNDYDNVSNIKGKGETTINSTGAKLTMPQGKSVKWAGLFWQATLSSNYTQDELARFKTVKFKHENEEHYTTLSAEKANWAYHGSARQFYYQGFKDVTSQVNANGTGYYWVGDLVAREGRPGGGSFAGWSLIVIYEDDNEPMRNTTIFYGYKPLGASNPRELTSVLSGFRTPREGDISSKLFVFGGEGDVWATPGTENASITDKSGQEHQLYNTLNPKGAIFNSTITNNGATVTTGKPYYAPNSIGIDIDSYDVSSIMGHDQSSTTLKFTSGGDGLFLGMYALETELYEPDICYDYALMDGNYTVIEDVNGSFTKEANGLPLNVKVTIRSHETDFDLINSKLEIKFTPNSIMNYIPGSAKYTLPNTNAYNDAVEINTNSGIISVGSDPTEQGGTISANETIYTIQSYEATESFNGSFEINVDSAIDFGNNLVPYSLKLKRCPTNPTYDPIYWKFNIEKPNVTFNTPEDQRYSLPTQITGRPYQVTIASYKQDPGGSYTVPNSVDATVELELISAGGFDNNSSAGFDTVCEEPSSIGEGVFVKLNNQDRKVINIPGDYPTYPSNLALRNATFRMWVLTKKVNSVTEFINNQCQSAYDNKCFTGVYASMYKDYDKMHLCSNSCNPASALSNSDSRQCYDCLKKYFGKPVCARDNFAIRPESFSIALSDDNQTTSANKSFIKSNFAKNATGIVNLAAGYLYRLDINATKYNSSAHENAVGYQFNSEFTYNKALLKFDDSASCNSKSDKNLNITLSDGKSNDHTDEKNAISAKNGLIAENTGKYKLNLHDNGWTAVDQKDYIYKPFPNVEDCIANSSAAMASGLPGCNIDSTTNAYKDLTVKSYPYKFEVNASVSNNLSTGKDYIYANDFTQIGAPTNIPNTMAIKIDKVVVAKDFNGNALSNYTSNCSAENLKLSYDFNTSEPQVTNINGDNLTLNYYPYDSYGVNASPIKDSLENDKDNITYSKESFAQSQNGSSNINTYINVKRTFNTPMNPFKINFNSLSLLLNKNIYVDLKNDYKASGDQDLNSSMIVYYGKAVASLPLYDDVVEDSINTPIKYEVFCNYTLEKCKDYGIDVGSANTDEYNWWINTKHDNNDPKADLISINNREVSIETNSSNVSLGIDNGVVVDGANIQTKPFVSTIGFDINTNRPWVVYNKNNNSILTDLYKVRFVGKQDAWSGSGKSGFTIDAYKGTSRKTNKIDW